MLPVGSPGQTGYPRQTWMTPILLMVALVIVIIALIGFFTVPAP